MLRRLPISLRFDDEDSEFYYGFIEIKKENRELSTLILNLLHVYYENELVRNAVDDYMLAKSPYMQIHEELQRIALEHNKQSVSTSMLGDFTRNEASKISEPSKQKEKETSNESDNVLMLTQEQLKDEVQKALQGAMSEIMKMMNNQNIADETQRTEIKSELNFEQNQGSKRDVMEETPKKKESTVVIPKVAQDDEQVNEDLKKVPDIQMGVGNKGTQSIAKKPASFGKLLNSVK